jgi:hypothetical protein
VLSALQELPWLGRRLPAIEEAGAEIGRIIDPGVRGALNRVLSRPPWQLQEASAARVSLERRVQSAVEVTRSAVDLHNEMAELGRSMERLVSRYRERFPALLDKGLREFRLTREFLRSIRRSNQAKAALRRLSRLERRLSNRERALERIGMNIDGWLMAADETASSWELASACALTLVERERVQRRVLGITIGHQAYAAHLDGILVRRTGSSKERVANHGLVLEDLLLRAARLSGATRFHAADAPLWMAALSVAADATASYRARPSLQGAGSELPAEQVKPSAQSRYMIPVADGVILISHRWRSPVRVWTATPRLSSIVEGQIVADNDALHITADVRRDIEPLFGPTGKSSGWYCGHRRVRVRLIAEFPDGWVGRIEREGELRRSALVPWVDSNDASQIRVLVAPPKGGNGALPNTLPLAAKDGIVVGEGFGGYTTHEVAAAIPGARLVWRRDPNRRGRAGERGLSAEWILFRELGKRSRSRVRCLRPLAWSAAPGSSIGHPLYEIPLALSPNDGPMLDSLLALEIQWRLQTVAAIARCLHEIHSVGHVLGTVHPNQFVYAVIPNGPQNLLVPRPILAYAPGTRRIGDGHVAETRLQHDGVVFGRIKVPLLNPMVAAGRRAAIDHDIYSFGVCALELLASEPVSVANVSYPDLFELVRTRPGAFADGPLALRISEALTDGSLERLKGLFNAIVDGLARKPEQWIALL